MDQALLQQRIFMVVIVSLQWLAVAAVPFNVLGILSPFTGSDGWSLAFVAAVVVYCFYTGYRAWKRGWKSRFILRIVVPTSLFVLSCLSAGIIRLLMR
jgi:hypothetical protein